MRARRSEAINCSYVARSRFGANTTRRPSTAVDQTMLASGMGTTNYTIVLTPANPASLAAGGTFTVKVTVWVSAAV